MKLATWNINSIAARLPLVKRWLVEANPDILCLQETKCTDDKFPTEELSALGYRSESFGQRTYNGVAILSKGGCENVVRGFSEDEEGAHARLIAAAVDGIQVVNVYIPNGGAVGSDKYPFKLEWMQRLRKFFDATYQNDLPLVLCGDFNVAPENRDVHDPRLWEGRIMFSEPERSALEEIKAWGFVDLFRQHVPEPGHFTWWDYRVGAFRRNMGLRIDHIWASPPLAKRCTGASIDKETRKWERPSDHAPVIALFDDPS
jgi:exodeoxyribonuclease-3